MWTRAGKDRWTATQGDESRNFLLCGNGQLAELHFDDTMATIHRFRGEPHPVDGWPLGEPGEALPVEHVDSVERPDLVGAGAERRWAALAEAIE